MYAPKESQPRRVVLNIHRGNDDESIPLVVYRGTSEQAIIDSIRELTNIYRFRCSTKQQQTLILSSLLPSQTHIYVNDINQKDEPEPTGPTDKEQADYLKEKVQEITDAKNTINLFKSILTHIDQKECEAAAAAAAAAKAESEKKDETATTDDANKEKKPEETTANTDAAAATANTDTKPTDDTKSEEKKDNDDNTKKEDESKAETDDKKDADTTGDVGDGGGGGDDDGGYNGKYKDLMNEMEKYTEDIQEMIVKQYQITQDLLPPPKPPAAAANDNDDDSKNDGDLYVGDVKKQVTIDDGYGRGGAQNVQIPNIKAISQMQQLLQMQQMALMAQLAAARSAPVSMPMGMNAMMPNVNAMLAGQSYAHIPPQGIPVMSAHASSGAMAMAMAGGGMSIPMDPMTPVVGVMTPVVASGANIEMKEEVKVKVEEKAASSGGGSAAEAAFANSKILKKKEYAIISKFLKDACGNVSKMELVFKASEHSFDGYAFHTKCDDVGATLCVIETENNTVFGGFTNESWKDSSGQGCWKQDKGAFIYLARPKSDDVEPAMWKVVNVSKTIRAEISYGPIFGYGYDFRICSNCDSKKDSSSQLDCADACFGAPKDDNLLGGGFYFKVKEYEVYSVAT